MPINIDECVYCDIQLSLEEGVEMLDLLKKLRAAGEHPALDETLAYMERQIVDSIEYVSSGHTGWSLKPGKPKH